MCNRYKKELENEGSDAKSKFLKRQIANKEIRKFEH